MATEHKHPVIFTGENPGLTLHAPGENRAVAAASYWRCTYSEAGEGNALIIWYAGAGGTPTRAIYADNAALGRFVTDTLTQHFGDFKGHGFADIAPTPARFFQESDSRRYHRVACHADGRIIELVWRDVLDRQQVIGSQRVIGPRSFELATVICPCSAASITVDGRAIPGEVRVRTDDGGRPGSSAFLAFAESWVDNGPAGA
ncbi:MAG TPA: hypothetical protein VFL91_26630 [Thermomicrobiales bacterium]|nr:hypothetical protein [Thermomicrobiales bacterium]